MCKLEFSYGDEKFICGAIEEGPGQFRAQLERQRPWPVPEILSGKQASQRFPSEWGALRCAEQMAVRWVQQRRTRRTDGGLHSTVREPPR